MNAPNKTFIKVLLFIGFFYLIYVFFISPPYNFPKDRTIVIKSGGLSDIAKELKKSNIIRSETFFKSVIVLLGSERSLPPGDYKFENKTPVWNIAKRIINGDHHVEQIKITIPEGFTNKEIASLIDSKFENISKDDFFKYLNIQDNDIYPLFPETYFFFPSSNVENMIEVMHSTYINKISALKEEITAFGVSEKELIIMASIIEKESKNIDEKSIIAGILWKRMRKGMLLQVDAAPETYKNKGLPSSPVCAPGLDSILAALRPIESPYFYYLHGKTGSIHYAKNFIDHDKNRRDFLLK